MRFKDFQIYLQSFYFCEALKRWKGKIRFKTKVIKSTKITNTKHCSHFGENIGSSSTGSLVRWRTDVFLHASRCALGGPTAQVQSAQHQQVAIQPTSARSLRHWCHQRALDVMQCCAMGSALRQIARCELPAADSDRASQRPGHVKYI